MKNSFFKELCSKVNYNTYDDMQKISFLMSFGITLVNDLMLKEKMFATNYYDYLAGFILSYDVFLFVSNGKAYTKDIVQIRNLYDEFIKNYNKLNKIFDLNDPIQIHVMFTYLLYRGYLSCNKEFKFSDNQTKDLNEISGINIITGNGVCRHISTMLTDILNDYGIESSVLGVYLRNYEFKFHYLDEKKYSKEELYKSLRKYSYMIDKDYFELIMNLIESTGKDGKFIEVGLELPKEKNILLKLSGNHAITYAFKDNKSYFLDSTQNRIYRMNDSMVLCDKKGEAEVKLVSSTVHNNLKNYLNLRKKVLEKYDSPTIEEEKKMILQTLEICLKNRDIFENFYKDNNELYWDISDRMSKVRKSIVFR